MGNTCSLPRLTIIQHGNYAEAWRRLEEGGEENYFAQRYTVTFLGQLLQDGAAASVTVVNASENSQWETLGNGVRTAGVALWDGKGVQDARMRAILDQTDPTHVVVSLPHLPILHWALDCGAEILPVFADSFQARNLRRRLRHWRLARVLNNPRIPFVANHSIAATRDLARIGVREDKLLAYDWPALISPGSQTAKPAPSGGVLNLLYVGQIIDAKGVGDAIEAVARLKAQGRAARLDIIGSGNTGTFKAQADALGLSQNVCFQGLRSHAEVLEAMRSADIVVVPSRHSYPEGLPMTLYEAMCMRTPLAVSDHPMFRLRIRDGQNAVVFSESDPSSMADALHRLGSDKALYETISRNHANAASEYLCPLKWHDLIRSFLNPESGSDLQQHSLAAAG